jgi:hypothetical protein
MSVASKLDGAVVFVTAAEDLSKPDVEAVTALAQRGALVWVAYPKAGTLGTDLKRDTLAALLAERGVQPVRQTSIDDTWSALRVRPEGKTRGGVPWTISTPSARPAGGGFRRDAGRPGTGCRRAAPPPALIGYPCGCASCTGRRSSTGTPPN